MESDAPSQEPAESERLVGTLINGKYRVLASAGAGGMGMIYRAEQLPLGRPVALKILRVRASGVNLGPDLPMLRKRFFREASILSQLQHPNIVTIYDYGAIDEAGEQYFMAMEFLSGKTLAERVAEGPLPIATAVRIASQIARGLGEAHAQGIVHRDLKPSNVMLVTRRDGEERVKVIDFGIVKLVGGNQAHERLTLDGAAVGSPRYMAPEQFLSSPNLDRRADIWALGVVLYRLLTGEPPFDGETTGWLIHDVLNATAPRVSVARGETPPALDQIVARCLERSPARRFASMEELAAALDALDALALPTIGAPEHEAREPTLPVPQLDSRLEDARSPSEAVAEALSGETTARESTVATSARSPAQNTNRASKVILGLTAGLSAGAIVFFVWWGPLVRQSGAESGQAASPGESAPMVAPTTLAATVEATQSAALPPPAPALESALAPPPIESAPTTLDRTTAGALPSANPSKPPPARSKRGPAKTSQDDDIPALR